VRTLHFHKEHSDEWVSRPFQGWEYRILSRWLKGYTLYFNGEYVASEARLNEVKAAARDHLASYQAEGDYS